MYLLVYCAIQNQPLSIGSPPGIQLALFEDSSAVKPSQDAKKHEPGLAVSSASALAAASLKHGNYFL